MISYRFLNVPFTLHVFGAVLAPVLKSGRNGEDLLEMRGKPNEKTDYISVNPDLFCLHSSIYDWYEGVMCALLSSPTFLHVFIKYGSTLALKPPVLQ